MRYVIAVLAVLGACGEPVPDDGEVPVDAPVDASAEVVVPEVPDLCGADDLQELLGQPLSGQQGSFPDDARIIPPDGLITQDYRPDRMNVDLDADGAIVRIWCG